MNLWTHGSVISWFKSWTIVSVILVFFSSRYEIFTLFNLGDSSIQMNWYLFVVVMLASKDNLNEPSALTKNEMAIFIDWTITKLGFLYESSQFRVCVHTNFTPVRDSLKLIIFLKGQGNLSYTVWTRKNFSTSLFFVKCIWRTFGIKKRHCVDFEFCFTYVDKINKMLN